MVFFSEAMGQPVATLALVSGLCGIGIFVVIRTLGNQILGLLLYPFSIVASLCVAKLFIDYHFYAHRSFDKWVLFTIFSAAIGIGLALVAYIILSHAMNFMRSMPKPVELNELRVRRIQLDAPRN